jgi:4-amino-4-deoxy-L-arabinose transferase-like glycosyltransferase
MNAEREARSADGNSPRAKRRRAILGCVVLLPLCSFLFFYRLADRDLWSSHEARAAMDARGILDGIGVLVPRLFDGRNELQKPPLYYWLVAAAGALGGGTIDARVVRLPAAISALGCVLGLAALGSYFGRFRAGLLSAVVLATAAHFTWLARIGRIDMPLTLTTTTAVIATFLALRRNALLPSPRGRGNGSAESAFLPSPRIRGEGSGVRVPETIHTPHPRPLSPEYRGEGRNIALLLVAYLAAAAGVFLKGPIGFILPAAALTAYLVAEGEWPAIWEIRDWLRLIRRLGLWWGIPLVLILTLPWFFAADEDTGGELFRVFFWYHNVERALGGGPLRSNPWWFYGPQFIGDFLPWSPLVIAAIVVAWRRGWLRDDPLARFGLAWFLGVFGMLSCAQFKRGDYLLPAYPGAALFFGCAVTRAAESWQRGWLVDRLMMAGLASAMVLFWAVRLEFSLPAEEPFRDYRPLASLIRREAPPPAEIVFFRTEAHALAFRVGRPLAVLVEWSDLEGRLAAPGPHFIVTPPACASDCRQRLPGLSWNEVSGTVALAGGAHERPILLLRAVRPSGLVSIKP